MQQSDLFVDGVRLRRRLKLTEASSFIGNPLSTFAFPISQHLDLYDDPHYGDGI